MLTYIRENGLLVEKRQILHNRGAKCKFRDKRTGEEFWIEAKYRNSLFKNKKVQFVCEICKPWQLNRYKEVEKSTGKKVYICLGIGDDPRFPETVHLISVSDAYPQLFQSRLKETLIWKNPNLK